MTSDVRHVYVHVPFCARRCSYCDFSIAVRRVVPVDEYLAALDTEIGVRAGDVSAGVETIYFGGGTPSSLGGRGIARALEIVEARFPKRPGAEITIEANPDDVSAQAVETWRAAGVNRVSLGAQSFNERVLAWMHRNHDSGAVERAVETLRRGGIENLSLDLIFALPATLERDLPADIVRLLALEPSHVSLYGLTVEPRTALGRWVARGVTIEAGEESYEEDYLLAHEALTCAGFEHYEVSNFGKPGLRAVHNSSYWRGAPYVAFGPSAHSYDGFTRRWNLRHYVDWRNALASRDPIEGEETLTAENRVAEHVYLGLRTIEGLHVHASDEAVIAPWEGSGWIQRIAGDRIRCTPMGWLRLDGLASALTHHRSR